ncbi:MAG: CRISPR-associated endonuclease Cas3'', partial [Psychromonas sp.]|nr:CRISPR-associated endonuclease Cas3'' [Psychromonas sp.]
MKDSELLNTNKVKKETDYIAHPDPNINGTDHQSVKDHLFEVSELAGMFASKIGQKQVGEILGLLHDFGKYSQSFQAYVKSATGIINPDEDDFVDAKGLKGKIDHSTAGAQWLYQHLAAQARSVYKDQSCMEFKLALAVIQILPLCIASHHSGLIDNLASDKGQGFSARLQKLEINSYFQECCKSAEKEVLSQAKGLVTQELIVSIVDQLKLICSNVSETEQAFYLGMYCKFMFSCLIDADRINSADFETPENRSSRNCKPEWGIAVQRVENFVAGLKNRNKIDEIRRDISNHCLNRAPEAQGIYSLSVPTGGGKTYSSLRYAVHHAKQHKLDRILYVIPYTSIIDQNAAAIREVLELEGDVIPWVLEHHSNLEPEQQTWHSKLVSENWDAP